MFLGNPKNEETSRRSNPFLAFPDTVETFSHDALMVNINRLERLTNFDAFFGRFDLNLTWVSFTGDLLALRLPFSAQKVLAEKWLV